MAQKTNGFERFWKELKRRKVIHVITVYAAVAFFILQVVDMVSEPLRLPCPTKALVIVLLCIGFVIAIFLSWVYDITPTGVKKTKPVSELKHVDQTTHAVSSGWKIATYLSAVIILALVAFNILTRLKLTEDHKGSEKFIAVLPFKLLSDEPDKPYLADGMIDAILLHLSKIRDLRVMSRTSVEQYRNPTKTTTAIGRDLDVEYLSEGSFQKFGDNVRLIVQLIKTGKEGHVWANDYDWNWNNVFSVQSEVAQAIAKELHSAILSVLGRNYLYLGQYEESLKYYKKYIEILKTSRQLAIGDVQWIGYAYWQNGYKKEAEYYFNEQISYCIRMNELKRSWGQSLYTYFDLADVYAFIGEKDNAYKNLRIFNKIQRIPLWSVALIEIDPLFNSIRNEPEFQQILRDCEAKYEAEHEKVKKWLEEQGTL